MSIVTETSNKTARLIGSLCSVIALVVGIPCLLLSFVPLFGALLFYPSVLALLCAIVGLVMVIKAGSSTGASITALVVTLMACMIAGTQYLAIKDATERYQKKRMERAR